MKNNVTTYRQAGLEAKWGKRSNGAPVMLIRNPQADLSHQRNIWWVVTAAMFDDMKKVGVKEGFKRHTLLGDVFSITA